MCEQEESTSSTREERNRKSIEQQKSDCQQHVLHAPQSTHLGVNTLERLVTLGLDALDTVAVR